MRTAFLLVLSIALLTSLAPAQQPVAHPEKLAAIKPAMQKFIDEGELSGVVTVVGRKDGIIHHEATGLRDIAANAPMEKDSIFRIASVTKQITAKCSIIIAEVGTL